MLRPLTSGICRPILAGTALLAALAVVLHVPGAAEDLPAQTVQLPAGLDPLVREYPESTDKVLKALKRAVDHYSEEKYQEALLDLSGVPPEDASQVGDYVVLYLAKSNLMLDRFDQAVGLLRLLETRYPDSTLLQDAMLLEVEALVKSGKADAALAALRDPKLEESAAGVFLRGTALEAAGKRDEAVSVYLRVMARYVTSKDAPAALERLAALSPGFQARPANYATMLERAENLLRSGRNPEARALLVKLATVRGAAAGLTERRRVLMAQAEYNLGRSTTILPLLRGIPDSNPMAPHALYLEAAVNRRLNREAPFLAARDAALRLFPQSPYTERILYTAATYYDVNNRPEECREAYLSLRSKFPKGEHSERALWRSSTLAYFLKRYDEALAGFWEYFRSHTTSRNALATMFWMGRCYDRLGDGERAAELYARCTELSGDSYHGQRAAEAGAALKENGRIPGTPYSGIDFAQVIQRAEAVRPGVPALAPPAGPAAAIAGRVHELASAGLTDLALSELRRGLHRFPEENALRYLMSRLYLVKEDYFGVIGTLRRAFPDYDSRPRATLPREVWDMLFPALHLDVIATQSARNDLDPSLVLGLIRQESAFDLQARSQAKALGLMQVLPSTGRVLAREVRIPRYNSRKLLQADVNIALGTRHLATLLQQFDRRVEFALAAYNAGDNRVDRWRRDFGDVDMAEFVERIPFGETRDYIKQVLTNAAYYRRLIIQSAGASR